MQLTDQQFSGTHRDNVCGKPIAKVCHASGCQRRSWKFCVCYAVSEKYVLYVVGHISLFLNLFYAPFFVVVSSKSCSRQCHSVELGTMKASQCLRRSASPCSCFLSIEDEDKSLRVFFCHLLKGQSPINCWIFAFDYFGEYDFFKRAISQCFHALLKRRSIFFACRF